jgi:hypothetical protein
MFDHDKDCKKNLIFSQIKLDSLAAAGRARIEEQKQTALTNIQKNREASLKQLDIQYASADKAKTSFGYIGITFLGALFGSIFANDFIKLCAYYFRHLRDLWRRWWQGKKEAKENSEYLKEANKDEIVLELEPTYADALEESIEKVYFKLVKANAKNKMTK